MSKNSKILIAEDDPFLGKIMGNYLKDEGLEVDTAKNGAEALDLIDKNGYKVILLDLVMPVKSGFDVLEELKKKKNKTPILVFTNLSQKEDEKEVMALGATGYYVKHNTAINDLLKIVQSYL